MSVRLEMLQVARVAPKALGDSAELVRRFIQTQQNPDGGFCDRAGQSDLYYTVFGLDGLLALESGLTSSSRQKGSPELEQVFELARGYLSAFGDGAGLDLVHLCCLARAWACLGTSQTAAREGLPPECGHAMAHRIEQFRSGDGGYQAVPGREHGTAYGCFLALGAYQDLKGELPDSPALLRCLRHLKTADGAWTNEWPRAILGQVPDLVGRVSVLATPRSESAGLHLTSSAALASTPPSALRHPQGAIGSTNATAAALTVLRQLGQPVDRGAAEWLLAQAHPQGGFRAMPTAPIPDLLSTATALHALAGVQVGLDSLKESCLDFVDSLWTNAGAFYGHWQDESLDVEYTYYALLALGHLTL